MNVQRTLNLLEKSREFWFLLGTCFVFFLLRLPSLFEPYWYGDEGIYEVIGYGLSHGRMLYSGIWDNKPPLLYFIYALFNGNQLPVKTFSLVVGLATVVVFHFLARKLFTNNRSTYVATVIFALLFALPLLEGNIANAENFMLLPVVSAALLIISLQKKQRSTYLFVAGMLAACAFLLKIVAVFDLCSFSFFLLITEYKTQYVLTKQLKALLPLFLGFIVPIFFFAIYFLLAKNFVAFVQGTFTQNVGYVDYGNHVLFPQGLLVIKFLLLTAAGYFIILFKKRLSKTELFIYSWLAFSLFNMFFSQRPYTHYLLVGLPSIALLLGLTLWKKATLRGHFLILSGVLLIILVNFHFYQNTFSYYGNFFSFVTSQESVHTYQAFFDPQTPIDYDTATYLKATMQDGDEVFIWGNSAQIYRLTNHLPPGRFTVAYHITSSEQNQKETAAALKSHPPRFLVIATNNYPFTIGLYHEKMMLGNTTIYERGY